MLLWPLLGRCAARAELSGPPAAVIQIETHGVSGTVIATGEGYTWVLSCGHGWYREERDRFGRVVKVEDERTKPMKFIFPTPVGVRWVTLDLASGPKVTSRLVALDVPNDLALVLINAGPAPYTCPVRDLYDAPQPKRLVAVGYDELRIPAVLRECHYKKSEGCWTVTRECMFHGSSGCSLQGDGFLCGVYTGYPSDGMPRGIERDPVRYKQYVLSSREGLWCRHSLIVAFLRGNGHGELLVRLNRGVAPGPATPRPNPPPAPAPVAADPFAGQPAPRPGRPLAVRGKPPGKEC